MPAYFGTSLFGCSASEMLLNSDMLKGEVPLSSENQTFWMCFMKSVQNYYLVLKMYFRVVLNLFRVILQDFFLSLLSSSCSLTFFFCLVSDFLICPSFSFCKGTRIFLTITRLLIAKLMSSPLTIKTVKVTYIVMLEGEYDHLPIIDIQYNWRNL